MSASLHQHLGNRVRGWLEQGRSVGYWTWLHAALFRQLARLGLHVNVVSLGDDRLDIEYPELPPGYSARPVALEELCPWVDRVSGLNRDFLETAIARGDRCVGNFFGDELVGYGFVTRRGAAVTDQVDVVIADWLVYRYKGWTHPEHRRKHLSHARGRINRTLFPLLPGMRTIDIVAVDNLPSRLKQRDVHPVRLGYCGYLRLFGRDYPFTSRVPRRFGFRLQRRAAPRRAPGDPRALS